MNSQEVLNLAKECGLLYNRNHEILDFYQKLRSSLKKEFKDKYGYQETGKE
tara:strand:- start:131 stop:283 length:153 start_codon:yes stop_codon:yes gene_type:complete